MIHKCTIEVRKIIDEELNMIERHNKRFRFLMESVEVWGETTDDNFPTYVKLIDGMYYDIDTPFEQFDQLMEKFYKNQPLTRLN